MRLSPSYCAGSPPGGGGLISRRGGAGGGVTLLVELLRMGLERVSTVVDVVRSGDVSSMCAAMPQ